MGYTHYWTLQVGRLPAEAIAILQEILTAAYEAGVVQYQDDDPRPPMVTETLVRFNGVGELGHESFVFDTTEDKHRSDGFRFDFCKTARKPYDTVVMKVLIVLKHYLGDSLKVASDGRFDEEWSAVRAEMVSTYGMDILGKDHLPVKP